MKPFHSRNRNLIYALLIFSPVFVQAGNMWTTTGQETLTSYNAVRTPPVSEQVNEQATTPSDQITSPNTATPRLYNPDPNLRSQNRYNNPDLEEDLGTEYNLDNAPDLDH